MNLFNAILIISAVSLNVIGQLLMKWQINSKNIFTDNFGIWDVINFLIQPWVIVSFLSVFGGAILWMFALSKVDLSIAYPFMGLSFLLIMVCTFLAFNEPITANKVIGNIVIVVGVIIATKGSS